MEGKRNLIVIAALICGITMLLIGFYYWGLSLEISNRLKILLQIGIYILIAYAIYKGVGLISEMKKLRREVNELKGKH